MQKLILFIPGIPKPKQSVHCNRDFFDVIADALFDEAEEAYEKKQVQLINN